MRKLAAVHVRTASATAMDSTVEQVWGWLRHKGLRAPLLMEGTVETTTEFELDRARRAALSHRVLDNDEGRSLAWELTEPTEGGQFRTTVHVAQAGDQTIVFVTLEAGRPDDLVAPTFVEARLPTVVRDILGSRGAWTCGGTAVGSAASVYRGEPAGTQLVQVLRDERRAVPVIVISDYEGLVLHPGIEGAMAADLAGLAVVARANSDACWALTRELGAPMSCYYGAIRLYWPGSLSPDAFRRHPLWTSTNLLWHTTDTEIAARRIRGTIRKMVFAASAMGIARPREIDSIERAHRRALFAAATADAGRKTVEDLFEEMDRDIERLKGQVAELTEQNSRLLVDLDNAKAIKAASGREPADAEEVQAAAEFPPATLVDAVRRARDSKRGKEDLVFGADVFDNGVPGMDPDAGPPEKVLKHLEVLADLAGALRKGPLGVGMAQWLQERGVPYSDESPQTMKNASERKKRTWEAGGKRQVFRQHTKPNDGTSPSKCVRIYFDWDEERSRILVGWVGRHP